MWPTARDGDLLVVEQVIQVAVGDLAVVRIPRSGHLVAHRLIERRGALLRCANARGVCDPWVHESQVFGRVVAIERAGRLLAPGRGDAVTRWVASARLSIALAKRAAFVMMRRVWSLT